MSQPDQTGNTTMNSKNKTAFNRTRIRSIGVAKINRLVRAAAHLQELQPAFAEWANGEIYVCKKTASYRYRFGEKSKSPAAWSTVATKLFATPEEFAFAAMVFATQARAAQATAPATPARSATRVNVISIAA